MNKDINKKYEHWLPSEPFPEIIAGKEILLCQHDTSDNHINEMINLEERNWDDFKDYLMRHFPNYEKAKKYIEKNCELAQKGHLVDYAIKVFSGKTIGGLRFINQGYKICGGLYYLDRNYRGMNFSSKALSLAEPELAKLGFEIVALEINENNYSSITVARKNNYVMQPQSYPLSSMLLFTKDITNQR